jgi:hypothetical protein
MLVIRAGTKNRARDQRVTPHSSTDGSPESWYGVERPEEEEADSGIIQVKPSCLLNLSLIL